MSLLAWLGQIKDASSSSYGFYEYLTWRRIAKDKDMLMGKMETIDIYFAPKTSGQNKMNYIISVDSVE